MQRENQFGENLKKMLEFVKRRRREFKSEYLFYLNYSNFEYFWHILDRNRLQLPLALTILPRFWD